MVNMREMVPIGVVACPACSKRFVYVYSDTKGHTSVPCPRCSRISMVDYERLKAKLISPKKRAI